MSQQAVEKTKEKFQDGMQEMLYKKSLTSSQEKTMEEAEAQFNWIFDKKFTWFDEEYNGKRLMAGNEKLIDEIKSFVKAHYTKVISALLASSQDSFRRKVEEIIEGKKIKWVEGALTDKEKTRLKNIYNRKLDEILAKLKNIR